MRIACIYFYSKSVGGIATHLNALRTAAIREGDTFDILHSKPWKTRTPCLFPERQWILGGDTKIWVDGEVPQNRLGLQWLNENYDAIYFGYICPHESKAYTTPDFQILYESHLPKVAGVTDGYWKEYAHWAIPLLPKLKGILCVQPSYATALEGLNVNLKVSPAPFIPARGKAAERLKYNPLLIWPNQWKNIKGITEFMEVVPSLPLSLNVELYSTGIRYYQMRHEQVWRDAVNLDIPFKYNGQGRATFFGNVDTPDITRAYQRAWFTVNLQGIKSRNDTYKRGSYNLTEVEALYYGACPILHESTLKTSLPKDVYLTVSGANEIPGVIKEAIRSGFALSHARQKKAKEYILDTHLASNRYQDLKDMFQ